MHLAVCANREDGEKREKKRSLLLLCLLIAGPTAQLLTEQNSGTEGPLCWFEGHIHDFPSSDVDIGYLLNPVVMLHFTTMFFIVAVLSVHLLVMAIFYGCNFGLYWALYATERQIASKSRLHTLNKFKRYLLYGI